MKYYVEQILLADGWAKNKTLVIDHGLITEIIDGKTDDANIITGIVIPGMVNCHSHAFQRAFAGFSEQGSGSKDSFWTWRQVMYKFLAELTTHEAQTIATQLYIEMLKMGYTRVAEFHYLHHQPNGEAYPELAAMAHAIFSAAQQAGIGLTMLPVLYQYAGFGEHAPNEGQKRFINSTEQFNQLVTDCVQLASQYRNSNVGIAPHSLRAVSKNSLLTAVDHVKQFDQNAPIHIHIAEQQQEVNDCITHYGKRPVEWLLANAPVDQTWCLIHATHLASDEITGIAQSQAIAGICPTTEANLGDGIFPTAEFLAHQGKLAIGSDSHISVNPIEELRWLEYAQRLSKQQRAVLASKQQPSVGHHLWQHAAIGGAQATNSNTGSLAVGKQADLVVLDQTKLSHYAHDPAHLLDSLIFACHHNCVTDVMVDGHWVVQHGQHLAETATSEAFTALLAAYQQKHH